MLGSAPADSGEQRLERLEETLWVIQARAGEPGAFANLLNRYEKPLLYYLRRLVPRGDAALDLHQEVWVDAFRGLRSLQAPEAFRVWIYRIAHHKAARFVRQSVRREELTESLADDAEIEVVSQAEPVYDAESLHKALDLLPTRQREILTLHYLRDLSLGELALVLECPPGTVKSRLFSARNALRNLLERKPL